MPTTTAPTRPTPLSEAQREVLSAAALRAEAALIMPARLKGKAAERLGQALLDKGLVREIRAKGDLPAWRRDAESGRGYSLVLTKAGRTLVASPGGETRTAAEQTGSSSAPLATGTVPPDWPRAGSKMAAVITLLDRDRGSSVAELMTATGWLPHTTRAALTSLRKHGYPVLREAGEAGSVYRIGRHATPEATAAA